MPAPQAKTAGGCRSLYLSVFEILQANPLGAIIAVIARGDALWRPFNGDEGFI